MGKEVQNPAQGNFSVHLYSALGAEMFSGIVTLLFRRTCTLLQLQSRTAGDRSGGDSLCDIFALCGQGTLMFSLVIPAYKF